MQLLSDGLENIRFFFKGRLQRNVNEIIQFLKNRSDFFVDDDVKQVINLFNESFLNGVEAELISRPNKPNMSFNPETHRIQIPVEGLKQFTRRSLGRSIAHEIVHAYTANQYASNPEFKKLIDEGLKIGRNKYPSEEYTGDLYGLKNQQEFIAEFMTKPSFREKMKAEMNWWQKILNWIGSKLNIDSLKYEVDVDSIISNIENVIEIQNQVPDHSLVNLNELFTNNGINQNYQQHSQQAQQELQRQIDNFKTRGYSLDKQETVEKELSAIRKKMLSGMKSILKIVDQIGANKSDEFKANLKYQITNLQDNTISDIENIVYFIKTLSQDLVPVA